MRNHEGYYDPTAGKAVRRIYRAKRRKKGVAKCDTLTYYLGEVPSFKELLKRR